MKKHCPFCSLSRRRASPAFETLFPNDGRAYEIIEESENFFVVLDAAPLTEGHSLIVSKQHLFSIYSDWHDKRREVLALRAKIERQLRSVWGAGVVLCEHGSMSGRKNVACIQHAHIHLIPSRTCLAGALREEGLELEKGRDYDTFPRRMTKQYLLLRDMDGTSWAAFENEFPSQLIRQVFAKQNSLHAWNWRDYVDMPTALGTRTTIASAHQKLMPI